MSQITIETPSPEELTPGLVMYLCARKFIRRGGICHHGELREDYYTSPRPFLLVSVSGLVSEWVGVFPFEDTARVLISEDDKQGHPGWCDGDSWAHPNFRWTLSYAAFVSACGRDLSRVRRRNTVSAIKTLEIERASSRYAV